MESNTFLEEHPTSTASRSVHSDCWTALYFGKIWGGWHDSVLFLEDGANNVLDRISDVRAVTSFLPCDWTGERGER